VTTPFLSPYINSAIGMKDIMRYHHLNPFLVEIEKIKVFIKGKKRKPNMQAILKARIICAFVVA
jgi:hypothetical protein